MGVREYLVVSLVVGARLVLPLAIPYVPLPAIISCLIIDAADHAIFKRFPAIDLAGYQSYDKALDTYYLTIAYLATVRNWRNQAAFRVGRFLFYYRLLGALVFELTQLRVLLFVFPNTFEYFFIFCEIVLLRWDLRRLTLNSAILAAGTIWVFVKLPMEWWIHIARIDTVSFLEANWPYLVVSILGIAALVWWAVAHVAPAAGHPSRLRSGDHPLRFRAPPLPAPLRGGELYRTMLARARIFDRALLEKAVLATMVMVIFSRIFADQIRASLLQIVLSVVILVTLNALGSQLLARRGRSWKSVAAEFGAMLLMNLGLAFAVVLLHRVLGPPGSSSPIQVMLFFVVLLTLIIVLFDRYHTVALVERLLVSTGEMDGEGRPVATSGKGALSS